MYNWINLFSMNIIFLYCILLAFLIKASLYYLFVTSKKYKDNKKMVALDLLLFTLSPLFFIFKRTIFKK